MDSSESGWSGITDSSVSEMRSDRLDDSSDDEEASDYSLADSYDEEVADVHEHENQHQAQAEKEKGKFNLATMIKKSEEGSSKVVSSKSKQTSQSKKSPTKSISAKFNIKELHSKLIAPVEEGE